MKKEKYSLLDKKGFLSSKNTWRNLFKGNKFRLFLIILLFLSIIALLIYGIFNTLNLLWENCLEIINRNFGKLLSSRLIGIFFSAIFLAIFVTLLSFGILWALTGKKANKWFTFALYLIFIIAIFGFFALDSVIGNQATYLKLWDEKGLLAGEIKCEGPLGPVIVGDSLNCKTNLNEKEKYNLSEERIMGVFTINGGESIQEGLIALNNTTYLGFRVYEMNINRTQESFTVGTPYSFITKQEFENNRERFLQAFLALIAIIFVTVPIVIINFRNLWRDKK